MNRQGHVLRHERLELHLPMWQPRELVHTLHRCEVSMGQIVDLLHCPIVQAQSVLTDLMGAMSGEGALTG